MCKWQAFILVVGNKKAPVRKKQTDSGQKVDGIRLVFSRNSIFPVGNEPETEFFKIISFCPGVIQNYVRPELIIPGVISNFVISRSGNFVLSKFRTIF